MLPLQDSAATKLADNSSQGLSENISTSRGMEARAVSTQMVKDDALQALGVFIIGDGSGTAFNKSLGQLRGWLFIRARHNGALVDKKIASFE